MATARGREKQEAARQAYREALEAARANPTSEAWARLLAAGRELSPGPLDAGGHGRARGRREATPSVHELERADGGEERAVNDGDEAPAEREEP